MIVKEYCANCGEPIDVEDTHYEFPDGAVVCDECMVDWVHSTYRVYGEVALS